jgi:hypothetical protein
MTLMKAVPGLIKGTIAALVLMASHLAGAVTNYTDMWFNPAESGWGVSFTQDYNGPIFATFFVYGLNGGPTWVVSLMTFDPASGEYAGSLYETAGGAPLTSQSFNSSVVQSSTVGTARFTPADASSGTLAYSYLGNPVVKKISRQPLYTPGTASNATFLTFTPGGTAYRALFESRNNGLCSVTYPGQDTTSGTWRIFPTAVTSTSVTFNLGTCDANSNGCVISAPVCTYTGDVLPNGRVMSATGTLNCAEGRGFTGGMTGALAATFYETEHTDAGVNGKLLVAQGACKVQSIFLIQRNDWLNQQFP